jgi:hypothetical protein
MLDALDISRPVSDKPVYQGLSDIERGRSTFIDVALCAPNRLTTGPAAAIMDVCASEFFCRCFRGRRMQTSDSKTYGSCWARSDSLSVSEATITFFLNRVWPKS